MGLNKARSITLLVILVLIFFWKFILQGLLPIPSDTVVGLYHPFRDLYAEQYPNGIPFKNFLITDPVRQQYPWRELSVSLLRKGELPLWNPYSFAGTPLLGNLQSAPFYPLNILFFLPAGRQGIIPFKFAWSILVILQPILAGVFMFMYLRQIKLHSLASFLGGLVFSFSGFFIAWLEWNTILHVALWLPLILYLKEKVIEHYKNFNKFPLLLFILLVFAESSYWLAGHLQTAFYILVVTDIYLIVRVWQVLKHIKTKSQAKYFKNIMLFFLILPLPVIIITLPQILPGIKFILNSSRSFDPINWQRKGWFIPWKHLVQFLAPDFFGNPTTLNYWGVWNYGEFIGYVGIAPLILAFLAIFFRRDKKTLFFTGLGIAALLFVTPNPVANLPFQLKIPLISTSQPTRLLFIIDFSLAILAALGFDMLLRNKFRSGELLRIIIPTGFIYAILWLFAQFGTQFVSKITFENVSVARRNLILPTILFLITVSITLTHVYAFYRNHWSSRLKSTLLQLTVCGLLIITVLDLFRFGWKFTPFTKQEYLFPSTKAIEFLQKQKQPFRIMTTDKRILPPNFSTIFRLQDVAGYDPLYLKSYGELAAAWARGKPDISPMQFNRIITPQDYESRIADLLNVKYVLSLDELRSEKLAKIFEEGQTKIYENKDIYPRAFLVESVIKAKNKQEAIEMMFNNKINLKKQAIIYDEISVESKELDKNERVNIIEYSENTVEIETNTNYKRLLILSDNYYPSWSAYVYPEESGRVNGKKTKIYKVDYNLRGILVPSGKHHVLFKIDII